MDFQKIKVGQTYPYRSRAHSGSGKVKSKYGGKTGSWVQLHDSKRDASVIVRPSQVGK